MSLAAEIERLEVAMRDLGWADHISLYKALWLWDYLSREVHSYEASIDDYTNDLCTRDYIKKFSSDASDELSALVSELVSSADTRFRNSTVSDTDGRVARYYRIGSENGWWWHRRPETSRLAAYLAED